MRTSALFAAGGTRELTLPDIEPPLTIIERRPGWQLINLAELWKYRELLYFLAWRDVKVRYKQTVLGAAWAVLQPLATVMVFSLVFERVANVSSAGIPYPLFVFAGLLPWTLFANGISAASQSVVTSQHLVTKIYFPRLIIPFATVAVAVVDFLIGLGVLLAMMIFYEIYPGWGSLLAGVTLAGLLVAGVGVGTLLAALTVKYRDFRHVVPFMVQLWMFATPSIYMASGSGTGSRGNALLALNPAQDLIANFRVALLEGRLQNDNLAVSGAVTIVLLGVGCMYFRRVERSFADII